MWSLSHSLEGQIHGCNGAIGGVCFAHLHDWQEWIKFSIFYQFVATTHNF